MRESHEEAARRILNEALALIRLLPPKILRMNIHLREAGYDKLETNFYNDLGSLEHDLIKLSDQFPDEDE